MSRFVDTMIATASGAAGARGMTTGEPHEPTRATWAEVHARARRVAGGLTAAAVRPHSAVGVLAAAPALIAPVAQAAWLVGASVTMLHQPTQRSDLAEWAQDTLRVLGMIDADLVLLGDPFDQLAGVLDQNGVAYRMIEDLLDAEPLAELASCGEHDPALLQLTSGSTAEPKAVQITHGNLYSNMSAMIERSEFDPPREVMASWLPLFHDMGMVGLLTVPMTFGIELVKVTPVEFLSGPLIWPDLISRYRATMTAAPNFAYAIAGKRLARVDEDDAYDLSSLRIALNGAEPVDASSMTTFIEAGERFGLDRGAVFPAYGLAESTLAVSFAPLNEGLQMDVVEAVPLEARNEAVPVPAGDPRRETEEVRSFAMLGQALPGLEVEVVAEDGARRGEREVGEIKVRGEAISPGYLTVDGPQPTQDERGWFATGDLGYLVDGEIVICGRAKDVIIMGGRNLYPTDIERAAAAIEGVRAGNVVAARLDAGTGRERFAVVLESTHAGDDQAEKAIERDVAARVRDAVEMRPYSVLVLPPGSLLKTPSGKVKRAATASSYAEQITSRAEH